MPNESADEIKLLQTALILNKLCSKQNHWTISVISHFLQLTAMPETRRVRGMFISFEIQMLRLIHQSCLSNLNCWFWCLLKQISQGKRVAKIVFFYSSFCQFTPGITALTSLNPLFCSHCYCNLLILSSKYP